jgi:hypothetical protein
MPPLQPTIVECRLGKVDQKSSDKVLAIGAMTIAENSEILHTGRYQRRSGSLFFDNVPGANRIHEGERELLVGTSDTVYSDLDGSFDARGTIATVKSDYVPINNSTFEQLSHDFCQMGGLDWHVWTESSGIFYCVRDSATGAYLVVDGLVVANGVNPFTRPKILAVGTNILITYVEDPGGNNDAFLRCKRIQLVDPTLLSVQATIEVAWTGANGAIQLLTKGPYDVVTSPTANRAAVAYWMFNPGSGNHFLRLKEWNVSTMAASATLDSASAGNAVSKVVSFASTSGGNYTLVDARSLAGGVSASINRIVTPVGLGGAIVFTNIFTAGAAAVNNYLNISGTIDSIGTLHIIASLSSTTASARSQLWYLTRTSGGVNAGPNIRFGFTQVTKIFTFNGVLAVYATAGVTFSTGQDDRTGYLIEVTSGTTIGRATPSLASAGTATVGLLPEVNTATAGVALIPAQFFPITSQQGATLVRLDLPDPARWLEVAGVTLIPGSSITVYDGAGLSELGFNHPPSFTLLGTGVGGPGAGIYGYRATWRWIDAQGRQHDSDASEALTVNLGGVQHAVITTGTLNATLKSAPVQQAVLALWRTTVNPSSASAASYFLVTTVANVPSSDTIVIADTLTDASLITKERLYTLGNAVLGNTTPPPGYMLEAWGNRVWAAERDIVWFSKEFADGLGVAFSDQQFIQVSDDRGDVSAIANAGPRFAIFKRTAIYTLSGDGPDNTGKGAFSPVRRLPVPLGARSSVATIGTELGVFFQDDASGQIWLLPPDGDPVFVGREVSDLAPDLTILDMVVVSDKRQVRIFSEEGTTLVYDLLHQAWTWFTDQETTAAALVDGVCGYVTPDGDIRFDDPETFEEGAVVGGDGVAYTQVLETAWIATNQIGGYQRTFAVVAIGEKFGDHTIAGKLTYRYNNGMEDEGDVDASTIDSSDMGYRVEFRPKIRNQRATTIKIRLEDDAPLNGGFGIEAFNLTVGIRSTRERLPKAAIAQPVDP